MEIHLWLKNQIKELENAKNSFSEAFINADKRKERSEEHYKQYLLSSFALSVTNYRYSQYHQGYREIALRDFKDIISESLDSNKANLAIDTI